MTKGAGPLGQNVLLSPGTSSLRRSKRFRIRIAIGSVAWLFALVPGMGLFVAKDSSGVHTARLEDHTAWTARWITALPRATGTMEPNEAPLSASTLPIFRREFNLAEPVRRATLRISGLGQYEVHINGRNVTETVLNPAWSDYRKRVFYNTYDVTRMIGRGPNAIGVMLGNGMYNVVETKGRYTKFSGSFGSLKLIAQLDVELVDGKAMSLGSDDRWTTAPGPITFDSIYGGEDYDARLEQPGWDQPGFNDQNWAQAAVMPGPAGRLVPESIPPIREFDRYKPVTVTHPRPGTAVYDLGENFAGWPEIEVAGPRGASVTLLAGELLDSSGFVTQRSAYAFPDSRNSFTYVLKGGAPEVWHPAFSYYGFRYVQVETAGPQPVVVNKLAGRFLHDAAQVDGQFSSSDELLNRIHTLIDRAMLSNMMSVLTDCPHREKLGWLEQTHLAASSLMYNYDLDALYAKVADDMQDAQQPDGLVPDIAPEFTVFAGGFRDSPEWGSALILSTWQAYQFYGETGLLSSHYEAMQRYAAYLTSRSGNHLLEYGLGDWYDIGPKPPGESQLTSKGLTATAIYYQDLTTIAHIATLLGRAADAAQDQEEASQVKDAFNARFFHPETEEYDSGSQTANAMPLVVGLVPEPYRVGVLAKLVQDIRKRGNHVTAGDIGFHYVVQALTDGNRSDVLYDMLSRSDSPSYGYQLAHGATTLTEAWDANPDSSQNHFMLGHAEEWFYRGLAGIDFDLARDSDERIRIHPSIVGNIRHVTASYRSRLGTINSSWYMKDEGLRMNVGIPAGVNATLVIPDRFRVIAVNDRPLRSGAGIRRVEPGKGSVAFVVSSGVWRIRARRTQRRKIVCAR